MKITRITLYKADVPVIFGVSKPWLPTDVWKYSKGRVAARSLVHLFTEIETDAGVTGIGEIDIYHSNYISAFVGGVEPGVAELAPILLGKDPRQIDNINRLMDATLYGHLYVKQPLDMACWDILGKSAGMPLVDLWGGRVDQPVPCVEYVPRADLDEMKKELTYAQEVGYRNFQVKLGVGSIEEDIAAMRAAGEVMRPGSIFSGDGNRSLTVDRALQLSQATSDIFFYWEQPCDTYEELVALNRKDKRPIVIDEGGITTHDIIRAYNDGVIHGLVLKVSRVGGMTKARKIRDLCVELRIPMLRIEDAWGSAISTAATTHLAQSTPPELCYGTFDARASNGVQTGFGMAEAVRAALTAPEKPGLGMELNREIMEHVAEWKL